MSGHTPWSDIRHKSTGDDSEVAGSAGYGGDDSTAADSAEPEDKRPVYQGDWNSASAAERGRHAAQVKKWKLRQAERGVDTSFGQPVPRQHPADSAEARNRAVLEGIRDDKNALASDRIRAAQQLIALDKGAETAESAASDLVTLRSVLELLDPAERLQWLQSERVDALQR